MQMLQKLVIVREQHSILTKQQRASELAADFCRTSAQDEEESPNVLLSLKRRGAADDAELKCLAINKVQMHPALSEMLL